jgi:hypothetical protein
MTGNHAGPTGLIEIAARDFGWRSGSVTSGPGCDQDIALT